MVLRLNWGTGYTETQQDITGATTILPPAELLPGRNVVYFLDQDGTGNHAIDFDAAFQFDDGFTQPISDAADKRRTIQFVTTFGGTLVYNQDFTSDIPSPIPQDFLSEFKFDTNGLDSTGYYNPLVPIGNMSFGTVGLGTDGLTNSTGSSQTQMLPAGPEVDLSDERSYAVWFAGGQLKIRMRTSYSNYSTISSLASLYGGGGSVSVFWKSYWYDSSSESSSSRYTYAYQSTYGTPMSHWVFTRSSVAMKVYVDGTEIINEVAGQVYDNLPGFPGASYKQRELEIEFFDTASADELKIYDRVLTPEEITSIYETEKALRQT